MKQSALTVLLAKIEATAGVDAAPTGALNAVLAFDVTLKPMQGQEAERKRAMPYFSAAQRFPTGLYQELTFETELIGNAAKGTAPAWSALARAAGMAEVIVAATSVTYNPVSTGLSTATLWFYIDGLLHKLTYARGDVTIKVSPHGIPRLAWRFIGLFTDPTDAANVAPTLGTWQEPQVANYTNTPTFTFNGVAAAMRSFELALNNKLIYRELVNARRVEIVDRDPSLRVQVEVETLATLNPFTMAKNQTPFAVNLVHGVGAGKIVTIAAPNCRLMRPDGYSEQDEMLEYPLQASLLPNAGNDEFTIALT